jgi:hypothetical protein
MLTKSEVRKIQKFFFLFSRNRADFISNSLHKKHNDALVRQTRIVHKPNINKTSRKLIKDLHEKLNENQIPHYEFLLFKGREYERKVQESKSKVDIKSSNECTFFPDTSITSSFYVKHKDKLNESSQTRNVSSRYKTNIGTVEDISSKLVDCETDRRKSKPTSPQTVHRYRINKGNMKAARHPLISFNDRKTASIVNTATTINSLPHNSKITKSIHKLPVKPSNGIEINSVRTTSSRTYMTPGTLHIKSGKSTSSPKIQPHPSPKIRPHPSSNEKVRSYKPTYLKIDDANTADVLIPIGSTKELYYDSSDEDYAEECKDIVHTPTTLVGIVQNRKEYLEDEEIDSYRKSDEEITFDPNESPDQKYPILFVDVNLGEDRVERLTVLEGDTASDVAHQF